MTTMVRSAMVVLLAAVLMAGTLGMTTGCERKKTLGEKVGEKIDATTEKVQETTQDVREGVGEKVEDAGEAIEETGEKVQGDE